MANGTGGNWAEGLPVWARITALIGVPSIIALGLVWVLQSNIPQIKDKVDEIHQDVLFNRKLIEQQAIRADEQLRLLRWICANTAKDDPARQRCFD